jgi:hypothetical protein
MPPPNPLESFSVSLIVNLSLAQSNRFFILTF